MQQKKLTPLEMLQKQKSELQRKSDRLERTIEKNARYLQDNFGSLLRDSLVESAISKMPVPLQNFTDKLLNKDFSQEKKRVTQELPIHKTIQGIAVGISEIAPFFLKGKKGVIISIALKQILKLIKI